jgi:hypothetical protein
MSGQPFRQRAGIGIECLLLDLRAHHARQDGQLSIHSSVGDLFPPLTLVASNLRHPDGVQRTALSKMLDDPGNRVEVPFRPMFRVSPQILFDGTDEGKLFFSFRTCEFGGQRPPLVSNVLVTNSNAGRSRLSKRYTRNALLASLSILLASAIVFADVTVSIRCFFHVK